MMRKTKHTRQCIGSPSVLQTELNVQEKYTNLEEMCKPFNRHASKNHDKRNIFTSLEQHNVL